MKKQEHPKDKIVTIRVSTELYNFFVEKALNIAQDERRIVKVTTLMQNAMEAGKHERMIETVNVGSLISNKTTIRV